MKKWTWGLGLCGILIGVSFGIAYVADRRLGVVAPWSFLLAPVIGLTLTAGALRAIQTVGQRLQGNAPVFVREPRPSRPRPRNRCAEGFVLFDRPQAQPSAEAAQ